MTGSLMMALDGSGRRTRSGLGVGIARRQTTGGRGIRPGAILSKKQWIEESVHLGILRILQKYNGSISAKQFEYVLRSAENKGLSPLARQLAVQIRDLSKKEVPK